MTAPNTPTGHDHSGFEFPPGYMDPEGRPGIDGALLGRFVGAAFDGCADCQGSLMDQIVLVPNTTARLVEIACVGAQAMFGGLPSNMTDPDVPGLASREFRELARAGLDGNSAKMFAACARMTVAARRAAAETAADLIIGQMSI